jgi:tetratricopeptide (TPR) repeat protein
MNDPIYRRALEFVDKGDYAAARGLLQEYLERSSGNEASDIHFWIGWCIENEASGNREQALGHYQKASAHGATPNRRLEACFRSGWLLIQDARWTDALQQLWNAIEAADETGIRNQTFSHALFWHAVALETLGRYIDAIEGYRRAGALEPLLAPEGLLREIACLDRIGQYEEALNVCRSLGAVPPKGFNPNRFAEIASLVSKEQALLERCLAEA